MEDYKPSWDVHEAGHRTEILDWIKVRKNHLKFRHTVLTKRQQLMTRLPEDREEEQQINELSDIYREFECLTTKQRKLGHYEDDEEFMALFPLSQTASTPDVLTEEVSQWPPPPPCAFLPSAKGLSDVPIPVNELGVESGITQCPACGEIVATEIVKKNGDTVWILCCMSSVFGCVAGCCLIPFCFDSLKDTQHSCPKCHTNIYTREKI